MPKLLQHKDIFRWTSMMTKEEWKKNDALMAAALKKMGLKFSRNKTTWEAHAYLGNNHEVSGCTADDWLAINGPNDPQSLGEIKYFCQPNNTTRYIDNIFFGVKNFAELQIKVDLMA